MNQPISINPDGLYNAANQFDDLEDKAKQILSTLEAACCALGEPWGGEKCKEGKQFAAGDKGYLANRDGAFNNLSQLAGVIGQNRDNLRDTAKTFEQQDEAQVTNSTPYSTAASPPLFQHRVGTVAPAPDQATSAQPVQNPNQA